ncbi:MAG: amidohydrolase family protein [Clostridiaceae bacterium]|nr:amidohydrolase family protein [Clostridiaceae bacterium]
MKKVLFKNLGTVVSGDIKNPILDADVIYTEDGVIKYVGKEKAELEDQANTIVDCKGLDVAPGLIDAHGHPPINDFLAIYQTAGFAQNLVASGLTSMVSVGASNMPGFPYTVSGVKAMAVAGKQVWENYRPAGVKIHGGALMLVDGLQESDFAEMQKEGINVVGEVGQSPLQDVDALKEMVAVAKKYDMVVTSHAGTSFCRKAAVYTADDLLKINPSVICALNGGPTPMASKDIEKVMSDGDFYYDVLAHGSSLKILDVYELAVKYGKKDKLMFGSDMPSPAAYSPLGCWTIVATLANAYEDVHPAEFIAMGTGNVADCYGLDHGKIAEGYKLDMVFLDGFVPDDCPFKTLQSGNMCSTSNVVIDAELRMVRCKNVPGVSRNPEFITK